MTWSVVTAGGGSENQTTNVVTIVAVTMVSLVCCACFFICAYKVFKHTRRRRVYFDRGEFAMLFSDRVSPRRVYNPIASNARSAVYVTDENIERCMPAVQFTTGLEVGEPVCIICFEEYA